MNIYFASLSLILISLNLGEGRLSKPRTGRKANGVACTAGHQCQSNCCSESKGGHFCSPREDGAVCAKPIRNKPGTGQEWLDAINGVREEYQVAYGGEYKEVKWSKSLGSAAKKWANEIAARCKNGLPGQGENPNDYGVATILNMRNPQMAVDRWEINGLNAKKIPSTASNPFTQMIWSTTEYVGCADSTSDLSGKSCTASVCYYGPAGNCGWARRSSWKTAVVSDKLRCSSTCPPDGECTEPESNL